MRNSEQLKKSACEIVSMDSSDVISMYKSKQCDSSLLPGKYFTRFDKNGYSVTVDQEITDSGEISRSAYILDELVESATALYTVEGKFMSFTSVKGCHSLFPKAGQAFQVDRGGCRFLGHKAVYSFKRVT